MFKFSFTGQETTNSHSQFQPELSKKQKPRKKLITSTSASHKCENCGKTFKDLTRHNQCEICNINMSCKDTKAHYATFHKCRYCDKHFSKKRAIDMHVNTHLNNMQDHFSCESQKLYCIHCKIALNPGKQDLLLEHLVTLHQIPIKIDDKFKLYCPCKQMFYCDSDLDLHIKKCKVKTEPIEVVTIDVETGQEVKQEIKNEVLDNNDDLTNSIDNDYDNDHVIIFDESTPVTNLDENNYENSQLSEKEEQTHKCNSCGKSYLDQHTCNSTITIAETDVNKDVTNDHDIDGNQTKSKQTNNEETALENTEDSVLPKSSSQIEEIGSTIDLLGNKVRLVNNITLPS